VTRPGERIYLSPPHLGGDEEALLREALASNWIAPLGPQVDAFEAEFAAAVGARQAVGLSSGTAALHLALLALGVGPGDEVVVSTLTFIGSVNPIRYVGAVPVLVDSETDSWNMDPDLLAQFLEDRSRQGRLPAAVVPVHLYGQTANLERILACCGRYGVPVIEDAAEALGATWGDTAAGVAGLLGFYSFNGNKVITTSGGGMLVTDEPELAQRVRKLATQAREPAVHYEHAELGYNYRLSNLLAAVGRGQLRVLEARVRARQANFAHYQAQLGDLPGVSFMPEADWGTHSRWLTVLTIDPREAGVTPEGVRLALEDEAIEARPVWKPMHQQPVYHDVLVLGGAVADRLFAEGLCLPSGSSLTQAQRDRVIAGVRLVFEHARETVIEGGGRS
jgi:dTDP-4-amino-4,6-dideoxygalactose transaminase